MQLMFQRMSLIAMVLLIATNAGRAQDAAVKKQYEILLKEYEEEGGARTFAKRFLALAEEDPRDSVSADALLWVVKKVRGKADTDRALHLLAKHHVTSQTIGEGTKTIARSRSTKAEPLLRAVLAKNPNKQAQALACFYLAALLESEANIVEQLKSEPELTPRVLQYFGEEYGEHLSSLKPVEVTKRREQVYAQMLKSFAKAEVAGEVLGKVATRALFGIRNLSVGKSAPEITGQDIHGKPMKLSGFRGKVVMLSFWGHW
jgi:hypothetical protein